MNVSAIIPAARQKAQSQGSSYVRLEHLSAEQTDELAIETLAYLRERDGAASELRPGWSRAAASQAGVRGAWLENEDLSKDERRRIRPLRTATYDLLEERGLVIKPPGQGSSVRVSPNDWSAFTEPPKVGPSPPKPQPRSRERSSSLRSRVEAEIQTRVRILTEKIRSDVAIDATDHWAVVTSDHPLDVVVRLVRTPGESGTFHLLTEAGRLDLSLEAAMEEWAGDMPLQQDLVDDAVAKRNWFSR
jgi:hypothetical protein